MSSFTSKVEWDYDNENETCKLQLYYIIIGKHLTSTVVLKINHSAFSSFIEFEIEKLMLLSWTEFGGFTVI